MNKSAIKTFAVNARNKLIESIKRKAYEVGVSENETASVAEESKDGIVINGRVFNKEVKAQRTHLIRRIEKSGFLHVIDEVAYTWFNRFIALRFMEVNHYLTHDLNIISSLNPTSIAGRAINHLPLNREEISQLVIDNKDEELYKRLIITQCNAFNKSMPFLFEKIQDYTELLFPTGLLNNDSVIREMVENIPEDDWKEVEIIGWLYQYYISEKKDQVFADLKKNIKITKENIPAATQIFTPRWIVQYMVENSVGKLWLESHPDKELQGKWKYFIEPVEQEPDVKVELEKITNKNLKPEDITILDPACGSGHILVYAFELLYDIYIHAGYLRDEIPALILRNNLYGLEIDDRAAQLAQFSVMMKARENDPYIFKKINEINICSIQETNSFTDKTKKILLENVVDKSDAEAQIENLFSTFYDAKEYGSILEMKNFDMEFWRERIKYINDYESDLFDYAIVSTLRDSLPQIVKQAVIMSKKYNAVITNPPYMGNRGMDSKLTDYVKKNFNDSKIDLFSIFMDRNYFYTRKNGFISMITQPSWLFLSTLEKLRKKILNNQSIDSLLHMGRGIFGIDFGSTSFILRKNYLENYMGSYFRLHQRNFQYIDPEDIKDIFISAKINKNYEFDFTLYKANEIIETEFSDDEILENKSIRIYFIARQSDFESIPGSPIAYWASDGVRTIFIKNKKIVDIAPPKSGQNTGDNDRFIRQWFEISFIKIGFGYSSLEEVKASKLKWLPYNKGGDFKKWYGNKEYVINWFNDGEDIKKYAVYRNKGKHWSRYIQNLDYMLKEGITWSFISSSSFGARYTEIGFLFDYAGCSLFPQKHNLNYFLSFLITKLAFKFLMMMNPTLNFQPGNIASLPIIFPSDPAIKEHIDALATDCISISRTDWDAFETSWDFKSHPFVTHRPTRDAGQSVLSSDKIESAINENKSVQIHQNPCHPCPSPSKIESAFNAWKQFTDTQFTRLKANEEELNRIFIDIYGLQDEMTPDVEDKDITIRRADLSRDIRSFISYAVGCMMGRYSLDEPGLIFAGGTFDPSRYKTCPVDEDAILPVLGDRWFDDDIVKRFIEFVKTVFGEKYHSENLDFIADALGKTERETSEERIRKFFMNDFYKDHLKVYQKRPIYWMFTSGKEKAFNTLVYMHRYDKDTLARLRKDYLHELQAKLDREIEFLEKNNEKKKLSSLYKQQEELRKYDELLKHYADQRIVIDLDDGVVVNYAKFGKLTAEIK